MTSDTITPHFSVEASGPEVTGVENLEWWDVHIIRQSPGGFQHHDDALPTSLRLSCINHLPEVLDAPIVTFTGLHDSRFKMAFLCKTGTIEVALNEIVHILEEDLSATATCVIV